MRRYRQRSEDERDRSRHRDQTDDRRPRSRGDSRSHKETDRFRDRLGSRDPASKASDRLERKPTDASLVAAPAEDAAVTEAPKERTVLKAGPAGGAYIPPFRLAQVLCAVVAAVHSLHCSKAYVTSNGHCTDVLLGNGGTKMRTRCATLTNFVWSTCLQPFPHPGALI